MSNMAPCYSEKAFNDEAEASTLSVDSLAVNIAGNQEINHLDTSPIISDVGAHVYEMKRGASHTPNDISNTTISQYSRRDEFPTTATIADEVGPPQAVSKNDIIAMMTQISSNRTNQNLMNDDLLEPLPLYGQPQTQQKNFQEADRSQSNYLIQLQRLVQFNQILLQAQPQASQSILPLFQNGAEHQLGYNDAAVPTNFRSLQELHAAGALHSLPRAPTNLFSETLQLQAQPSFEGVQVQGASDMATVNHSIEHTLEFSSSLAYSSFLSQVHGLPPCDEVTPVHFNQRPSYPLGTTEDPNWLSEFHCFVRSDMIEVFRASKEDCRARNKAIQYQQVGIRCRFCCHLPPSSRSSRSSAFPSSLRQIYQSFTMMLREHSVKCDQVPSSVATRLHHLKGQPAQGATDSKGYWIHAAKKIGLTDTSHGIVITETSRMEGANIAPFGTEQDQVLADDRQMSFPLISPSDRASVPEFLYVLLTQTQVVRLMETERIGNRRSLSVGLPGIGCKYCCMHRRLGLCRMFPVRRRTLPSKVNDIYHHIQRCSLTPATVKHELKRLYDELSTSNHQHLKMKEGEREFFDRLWKRLAFE
jgi:hypothetical protein